jgi:peptidoglycan hydrolase-like protein with peptidoglycan-binding domain
MEMKCEILEEERTLKGVVNVLVPAIYGKKGDPLPKRMAKLVRPAAEALQRVYQDITNEGGHLYISDMFRAADEQQKAYEDYMSGRKSAYSPPSCSGVHEAARAIDIDAFDTGIGHKRVREILNQHGWVNIVETLTGAECWHYEFREDRWERYKEQHEYAAMARAMKEEIGNLVGLPQAEAREGKVRWLQNSLNKIIGTQLVVNGIYGEETKKAVREFQSKYDLQVDGIAGPITKRKIRELLGEA